jgi:tetratricopeptide (TPR) repeat protein
VSRASRSRRASSDVAAGLVRRSSAGQGSSGRVPRLATLLLLTLGLKLALAFTLADHPLLQPVGDLDTGAYWRFAERVASGDILMQNQALDVSPLYIYWLALAQVLTGASVAGVLALQAVLGTLAVALTGLTAARWSAAPERAALVASGVLALTSIVALQEAVILQSALDPILMALFAWTTTRALQEPSGRRWAWSGVALALLATNRPNAWLLGIVVGLAAAFMAGLGEPALPSATPGQEERAGRPNPAPRVESGGRGVSAAYHVAALVIGVLVVLAPFALRSRLAGFEWSPLPMHGGLNFYIGNHAGANGTYTVVDGIRPSIEGQRLDMYNVVAKAIGRPVAASHASSYFVRWAIDWWRASPVQAMRLFARKLWLSTHSWELPVNVSHAWFREHTPLLWAMPFGAWLLVPLGLGVSIGGRLVVPEAHRDAWRWFRWLLPVYLLSVAIFFVVDRYRMPALVLGAIHVGLLASMTREHRARAGRGAVAAMIVAVVVFVAGLVPLPFQRGEADADTQMAVIAIDAGRDAEGEQWLASAVARHPAPGIAWFRAGLAWQARNDLPRAERALREAYRLDPEVSDVTFALAGVLLSQGKGADALPLLKQLQTGDGGAPTARAERYRLDIALAHWQNGDEALARGVLASGVTPEGLPLLRARALAAVEARQVALAEWLLSVYRRHAPGDADVAEKLGLMRVRTGDAAGAAAMFEEAARLDPARATARFNLAVLRAQQGRRDEAIALLQDALRIDPTYAQAAGALRELRGDSQ